MYRLKYLLVNIGIIVVIQSCSYKSIEVDLIVHNATIYTVDEQFSVAEAMAIKNGEIIEIGAERAIMNRYKAKDVLDAKKKYIYPGFIDAHCHFLGYGLGLKRVSIYGTSSWDEIVDKVVYYSNNNDDKILFGEGWDQNDWEEKEFPNNRILNEMFPNVPVILDRVDGHALIVNQAALDLAKIIPGQIIEGGVFESKDGVLTGILVDNAKSFLLNKLPQDSKMIKSEALLSAQENCFKVGLTTVDDAGLSLEEIKIIEELQSKGSLKMRIYAMISDSKSNLDYFIANGPIEKERLTVRSIKVYADGALGSRGASLLAPYSDKPNEIGFLLSSYAHFDSIASLCYEYGFQFNTHCIGDSANRILSDIYGKYLKGTNDLRWRIEHAQVVNDKDISKFKNFTIIPSVQPTHATSDMYWVKDRLGSDRIHEAYSYKKLVDMNGMIALGTDFPVENINPMLTFYAAVARKDVNGFPENSFLADQKLSRKEALMGMTIWAALSNFEENEKGSLVTGKFADFVILEEDIMTIKEDKLFNVKVQYTYVNGEEVYKK
jgi:predicted amidohydrolase YtcJ